MIIGNGIINRVIVLGGGSAGFMAAAALKSKLPGLRVEVIRSPAIGVIGVGEGSTVGLTRFFHQYLAVGRKRFFEVAEPVWKLGLKFVWGKRPHFFYPFDPGFDRRSAGLPKTDGYYCDQAPGGMDYSSHLAGLMAHNRVFERGERRPGPARQPRLPL